MAEPYGIAAMGKDTKYDKAKAAAALAERWRTLGVSEHVILRHTQHILKPPKPPERVVLEWWQRPDRFQSNGSEITAKDVDD